MVCGRTYKRMEDASHSVQKSDHHVHERLRVISCSRSRRTRGCCEVCIRLRGCDSPVAMLAGGRDWLW